MPCTRLLIVDAVDCNRFLLRSGASTCVGAPQQCADRVEQRANLAAANSPRADTRQGKLFAEPLGKPALQLPGQLRHAIHAVGNHPFSAFAEQLVEDRDEFSISSAPRPMWRQSVTYRLSLVAQSIVAPVECEMILKFCYVHNRSAYSPRYFIRHHQSR